jgi:hypothetical protein
MTVPPLDPAAVEVIDDYLAQLAPALGPRDRTARDLVAEVRDGLLTATEHAVARGCAAVPAARMAVRRCGAADRLAPLMRTDAVATRARGTALALMGSGPVAAVAWGATVVTSPASQWRVALPCLGLAVLLALACSLLANTASGTRSGSRVAQVAAMVAAVTCAGADLAALTLVAVWTVTASHMFSWPVVAAAVVSGARIAFAGRRVRQLWPPLPA